MYEEPQVFCAVLSETSTQIIEKINTKKQQQKCLKAKLGANYCNNRLGGLKCLQLVLL